MHLLPKLLKFAHLKFKISWKTFYHSTFHPIFFHYITSTQTQIIFIIVLWNPNTIKTGKRANIKHNLRYFSITKKLANLSLSSWWMPSGRRNEDRSLSLGFRHFNPTCSQWKRTSSVVMRWFCMELPPCIIHSPRVLLLSMCCNWMVWKLCKGILFFSQVGEGAESDDPASQAFRMHAGEWAKHVAYSMEIVCKAMPRFGTFYSSWKDLA